MRFCGIATVTMTAAAVVSLGTVACTKTAHADVTLPSLIGEGMVVQRDTPVHIWGKAAPGEAVSVTLEGQTERTTASATGDWDVNLKPLAAGGPFRLQVQGNNALTIEKVYSGEVWVCSGQSNMEFALRNASNGTEAVAASANPQIHLYHVPKVRSNTPLDSVKTSWQECGPTTVPGFSAVGYFFGRDLQKQLNVPIGLIESDWGGTPAESWTREAVLDANADLRQTYVDGYPGSYARYEAALAAFPDQEAKAKADSKPAPRKPAAPWRYSELYNGMIAPLVKYPIRGALWYQGESNTGNPMGYRRLLPAMILNWRTDWGIKDFPFLVVQLAPYGNGNPTATSYAELRESQYLTTKLIPNVGLAVITDVGNETNIHPTNKEPAGDRLALQARKIAYGEKVVADGPTFKRVKFDGSTARVTFDNVGGGLMLKGGPANEKTVPSDTLVGFTLAGPEGKFVPAEAKIVGKDTVEVSSPQVTDPKEVRFGFQNFMLVNLWNSDGLPACPFRSEVPKTVLPTPK